MGRKKKSETIEKININGLPVSDPQKIATEFNSFFSRVGTEISNSVPPVDKNRKIILTTVVISLI